MKIKAKGLRVLWRYSLNGFAFIILVSSTLIAQENIPVGTWRAHLSFKTVNHLAEGGNKIFAASANAVLAYDFDDGSFVTYSTLNALSNTDITAINYDGVRQQLIVAYQNGALDFIRENSVLTYTRLVNPSGVLVSPGINHILIDESIAFLSTDYGVVLFDLDKNEVRETWRNLGRSGQLIGVNQTAKQGDSVYLATTNGILKGKLDSNLLDFNQWQRFDTGDFVRNIGLIASHKNKMIAALDGLGIYQFNGVAWRKNSTLPVLPAYAFINSSSSAFIYGINERIIETTDFVSFMERVDPLLSNVKYAMVVNSSKWVADASNGLLKESGETWQVNIPNGPASPLFFRTKYVNGKIVTVHGDFNQQFAASNALKNISVFDQGIWNQRGTGIDFITDAAEDFVNGLFVSSFNGGLARLDETGASILLSENNTIVQKIASIKRAENGLWIASYGAVTSLHLLKPDNQLSSYSSNNIPGRYPFKIETDLSGNVWMLLSEAGGGGVQIFNRQGAPVKLLNELPGGGLLPDKEVLSIAHDKRDYMWVGTAKGLAYYPFAGTDAIRPIIDGRFVLSEERITALAVDEGDRKWVGTSRGLWLFDTTVEEVIYNFTTDNSPLPSNFITDIEINKQSGEVFIVTDKGLVSFRSDASIAKAGFNNVRIFPNPVLPEFSGVVTVADLMENAFIKIVDASGKLIKEIQANGGAASWNLTDYTGSRVSTGVYLVIAIQPDGMESFSGKIVLLD